MKLGKTATLDGLEVIAVKNVIASTQNNATQTVVNAEVNVFQVTWDPTAIKSVPKAPLDETVSRNAQQHVEMLLVTASMEAVPMDV